jgi:hypothetical protein
MTSLKLLVGALAMTFAVSSAHADSYPKESLKKINEFLAKLTEGQEGSKVAVTKAKIARKDKLLNEVRIEASMKEFSGALALKMKGDQVVAGAEFYQQGLMEDLAPEKAAKELNDLAKKVNDKGFYKATVKVESNGKGAKLTFEMVPASKEGISIDSLKVQLEVGTEKGKEFTKVGLKGKFNVKSDLVLNGRQSLTKVFDKIAAGSFPEEEDYAGLLAVLQELTQFLDDQDR